MVASRGDWRVEGRCWEGGSGCARGARCVCAVDVAAGCDERVGLAGDCAVFRGEEAGFAAVDVRGARDDVAVRAVAGCGAWFAE